MGQPSPRKGLSYDEIFGVDADAVRARHIAGAQKQGDQLRGKTFEQIFGAERAAEIRAKLSAAQRARVTSEFDEQERREKISAAQRALRPARTRYNVRYSEWQKAVRAQSKNTCEGCGHQAPDLDCHHLLPWNEYPDLRFEVWNGQALCRSCHTRAERHRTGR